MSRPASTLPYGLTARELRIIQLLCEGVPNKDIALAFGITRETVQKHMSHLCDKLGMSNRLEVALFGLKNGLVSLDASGERRAALLLEIEAAHREIEKYVSRSRMLVQQLARKESQQAGVQSG